MDALARLRALRDALPRNGSVVFTRDDLDELLGEPREPAAPSSAVSVDTTADLTVGQVAEELGRGVSTVRTWLSTGLLEGYRLRGREWRVKRDALRAFLDREAERERKASVRTPAHPKGADIGDWRQHYRRAS